MSVKKAEAFLQVHGCIWDETEFTIKVHQKKEGRDGKRGIPGTEDMKPYINRKDRLGKWLMGTAGFAIFCAVPAGIMSLPVK